MIMALLQDFDQKQFLKSGALFSQQGQVFLFWGQRKTLNERPTGPAIGLCDFFLETPLQWLVFEKTLHLDKAQAQSLFLPTEKTLDWSEADFSHFQKQFVEAKSLFEENILKKIVPYVFEKSKDPIDFSLLSSMIFNGLKAEQGYLYGSWDNGSGLLGLSPEILIQQNKNHFSTMALAGTTTLKAFDENPHDFLEDQKQKNEHRWVIQDIKEQLTPSGLLLVGETQIHRAVSLVHWMTPIELTSHQNLKIEDLVVKLHPTPALGAYPREYAFPILKKWNKFEPRSYFGAPFGFSENLEKALFVVAIRNILWDQSGLRIGSGCGVVEESDVDREWLELKNKRNNVKNIFFSSQSGNHNGPQ